MQKELTPEFQILIVGDRAVNKIKHFCSKKTPKYSILPAAWRLLSLKIIAEHPVVKFLIICTGALDVQQQSEVLEQEFANLLNKVWSLDAEMFLSEPLPTVWQGDERFSRLMMLEDTCAALSMNFTNNFNIFGKCGYLSGRLIFLNKSVVQLLSSNIFYLVHQTSAADAFRKYLLPEVSDRHERQQPRQRLLLQPNKGTFPYPQADQQEEFISDHLCCWNERWSKNYF